MLVTTSGRFVCVCWPPESPCVPLGVFSYRNTHCGELKGFLGRLRGVYECSLGLVVWFNGKIAPLFGVHASSTPAATPAPILVLYPILQLRSGSNDGYPPEHRGTVSWSHRGHYLRGRHIARMYDYSTMSQVMRRICDKRLTISNEQPTPAATPWVLPVVLL